MRDEVVVVIVVVVVVVKNLKLICCYKSDIRYKILVYSTRESVEVV